MKTGSSPTSNAWVQLYEARRMINEPQARPPGRPPSIVPRTKVGLTLTKGEVTELEEWQDRFSVLLGRKVSVGETVSVTVEVSVEVSVSVAVSVGVAVARATNVSVAVAVGVSEAVDV